MEFFWLNCIVSIIRNNSYLNAHMKETGFTILVGLILLIWVVCVALGANHFFGTSITVSIIIALASFFVFLIIGDLISELLRDKQYDADIKYIFTRSCKKCDNPLIESGQVHGTKPPFKIHCNKCEHDAIVDEHYEIYSE